MRTRLLVTTLLVLGCAIARGSAQQPTFPSRVDLVTVDVVVFDRQGDPVEGLTREDFTVREDGRPQQVAAFEAISLQQSVAGPSRAQRVSTNDARPDAAGRWFFIVFDDVHITQFATARAREAVAQFIEQALRPGDRVMIAPASGGANWTGELPQDLEDLLAYVERLRGERRIETGADRIWDHEAMGIALGRDPQAQAQVARRYFENGLIQEAQLKDPELRKEFSDVAPGLQAIRIKARQTYTEARSRLQVSLDTLERMAAALADARGRKTLLFFSEGFIMDTTLENFRTLVQTARNANVAIHFVDVAPPGGTIGQAALPGGSAEAGRIVADQDATTSMALATREADGTRSIAADTGGSTISGTNLLAGLTRVANEGRAYYLLGYSPTNTRRDGQFRKIEVSVNRPGVTVRARGGYFEPTSRPDTPRTPPDKLEPAVRAALDSPFGATGLPMRLTSYVLGAQPDGKVQTLLVAEADIRPLRLQQFLGSYSAKLDSYVLVHNRDRDSLHRDERLIELTMPPAVFERFAATGIPVQRELLLEPGAYQATLLLRDRATALIGSVRHEFEVPAPDAFRISTPVLTDTVQPATPAVPARPVPIARRTFRAGTRLIVAFEIHGAQPDAGGKAPRVTLEYHLRRQDGTRVAGGGPQPLQPNASGQFPVTIGLPVPPSASGEHNLVLTIRDDVAGRTIEAREALVIDP